MEATEISSDFEIALAQMAVKHLCGSNGGKSVLCSFHMIQSIQRYLSNTQRGLARHFLYKNGRCHRHYHRILSLPYCQVPNWRMTIITWFQSVEANCADMACIEEIKKFHV